ncbi:hypothetical protein RI543_001261 [Arxiozyma heterogenica]|uniref:Uncharacterized protein n=1 Tax=Arxiozyma heterogenica TaxID=278026 RepID=A0AAN7WIN6_9SACH|nr:hypothetical protein RI543_001261 [Kazachstania heterogenica]
MDYGYNNAVNLRCEIMNDLPRSYVIQSFYYAASNVVAHVWLINTLIGSRFIQDLINNIETFRASHNIFTQK